MKAYSGFRNKQKYMNWRRNRSGWVMPSSPLDEHICWLKRGFSSKTRQRYSRLKATQFLANKATRLILQGKNTYTMGPAQVGWSNCDVPIQRPRLKRIKAQTNYSTKNTHYFIRLGNCQGLACGIPFTEKNMGQQWLGFGYLPKNDCNMLLVLWYVQGKAWIASTQPVRIGQKIRKRFNFRSYEPTKPEEFLES